MDKKKFKKKLHCEYCKEHRPINQNTHSNEKCFYRDKSGWDKIAAASNYSAFHGSDATPISYFKDKPDDFGPNAGNVKMTN